MAKRRTKWDAQRVKQLRLQMGLSQQALADDLGTRQQTISEWEVGLYRPRGLSERLLDIVAERAGFQYDVSAPDQGDPPGAADAVEGER